MLYNEVYKKIKKSGGIDFSTLVSTLKIRKFELGDHIKYLEENKYIISYDNNYYDIKSLPLVDGYSQWSLMGACFFSEKDHTDIYGLSYDVEKKIPIFNKRVCFGVCKIQGKKLIVDENEIFIVLNSDKSKNINIIASYQDGWLYDIVTLNKFKSDLELNNGDVNRYIYNGKHLKFKDSIGNISDSIESDILYHYINVGKKPNFNILENGINDFLDKPFYTIDNISTKDVDDAIFFENENNNYKLYVAISDVTKFIKRGDEIDNYATNAATSFYLPMKTEHMLPNELSTDYCSLNVGKTRSALICEIIYDDNFNYISSSFYTKNILVKYRLSYNDVNNIFDNIDMSESLVYQDNVIKPFIVTDNMLKTSLTLLKEFTSVKSNENVPNSSNLNRVEYKLNENGKIDCLYYPSSSNIAQKLVETTMIIANRIAAQYIHSHYPTIGLFRNQNTPVDIKNPKAAFYDYNNYGHWGLNIEYYTHFTSPIRRYCDIIVHRLIKSIISNERKYTFDKLKKISDRINRQHSKSKMLKLKCLNILQAQYIDTLIKNGTFDTNFKITDILEKGIVVINKQLIECYIPNFKLDSVFLLDADKDKWLITCNTNNFNWYLELKSLKFEFTK